MSLRHCLLIAAPLAGLLAPGAEAHREGGGFYHGGPGFRPWGYAPPQFFRPPQVYAPPVYAPPPRPVYVPPVPVVPVTPTPPPMVYAPAAPVVPVAPAVPSPPARLAPQVSSAMAAPLLPRQTERSPELHEREGDDAWPGWLKMSAPVALVGGLGWYGMRRMKKNAGGPDGAKPPEDFAELPY